ncbi:MAG: choice-of-anchor J domain-containing protein [Flavobacteriales bacterium]|nr:choice-of-anchor J domain-containing protein [Flavobacteriales bacterium]
MKKLYTLVIVLGMTAMAHAQVLFSEDFDNLAGPTAGGAGTYTFPADWVLINGDGLTPAASVNYVNEAWERREDFANSVTDSAAFSTSWYTPAGTANDWMWTPPIVLTTNCQLGWNAVAYDASYPDGYEVRIWTAGGTPTSVPGASTVISTVAAEASTWTSRMVDLQTLGYSNQTVRFGFRNNSTDQFLLLIDDVQVISQVNNDVELVSQTFNSEYTIVPVSQLQPLTGSATIRNNGLQAASNVNLTVDVYDGLLNVIATVPATPVPSLAPGASANFTTLPITPPASPEIYQFDFMATMTQTDQIPSNNYLMVDLPYLIVDETMYARDNGQVTGSLGIGAGNGGYLGNMFEIFQATYLDSVYFYVNRGYIGELASAVLWNMTGGVPGSIIASSEEATYADDLAAEFTLGVQGGPFLLSPGQYVLTAMEYDSTLALGTTSGTYTPGTTWVNWPTNPNGAWSNSEDFAFEVAYTIRMILNDNPVGMGQEADAVSNLKVYPNPSNGQFMVHLTGIEGHADLTITDMTGRTVYARTVVGNGNLTHAVNMDLKSGAYLLNIISGTETSTTRIVLN